MLEFKKKAQEQAPAAGTGGKKSLKEIEVPNWLAIVLILAVVCIVGLVFFLQSNGAAAPAGTTFADEPSSEATQVEVLPQKVRNFTNGDAKNPFASDELGEVELTGIITNSAGKATVILQTGEASYIASEGETLPDSEWKIAKVGTNYVVFSLSGNEKTVWLNGATTSGVENNE